MTQDEILSMASAAGITFRQMTVDGESYNYRYVHLDDDIGTDEAGCVMRFAALVAAKAVAEEREACAQACDECRDEFNGIAGGPFVTEQGKNVHHAMASGAHNCMLAIRARGTNAN